MFYDIERIRAAVSTADILNYFGIKRRGPFIPCPNPGHSESKQDNCSVSRSGLVHCFVCDRSFDVFALSHDYMLKLKGVDMSFTDTCGFLCDIGGIPKDMVSRAADAPLLSSEDKQFLRNAPDMESDEEKAEFLRNFYYSLYTACKGKMRLKDISGLWLERAMRAEDILKKRQRAKKKKGA